MKASVSRVQPLNSISSLLKYPEIHEINGLSPFIGDKSNCLLVSNFTPSNFRTGEKEHLYSGANGSVPTAHLPTIFTSEVQQKYRGPAGRSCEAFTDLEGPSECPDPPALALNNFGTNNNERKPFESPMDVKITARQTKNSILGSSQVRHLDERPQLEFEDSEMEFSDKKDPIDGRFDPDHATRTRDHLKRKAKEMRNSKYDESFLVEYSGTRSKFLKASELDLRAQTSSSKETGSCFYPKAGNTTAGKGSVAKRCQKQAKKLMDKDLASQALLFNQIQQIKIEKDDLQRQIAPLDPPQAGGSMAALRRLMTSGAPAASGKYPICE